MRVETNRARDGLGIRVRDLERLLEGIPAHDDRRRIEQAAGAVTTAATVLARALRRAEREANREEPVPDVDRWRVSAIVLELVKTGRGLTAGAIVERIGSYATRASVAELVAAREYLGGLDVEGATANALAEALSLIGRRLRGPERCELGRLVEECERDVTNAERLVATCATRMQSKEEREARARVRAARVELEAAERALAAIERGQARAATR